MNAQHESRPVTVTATPDHANGYFWTVTEEGGEVHHIRGPGAPKSPTTVGDKGTVKYTVFSSSMAGFAFTADGETRWVLPR